MTTVEDAERLTFLGSPGMKMADLNVLIDGAKVHGACPSRMDPPALGAELHVEGGSFGSSQTSGVLS